MTGVGFLALFLTTSVHSNMHTKDIGFNCLEQTQPYCMRITPKVEALGFPGGTSGKKPSCQYRRTWAWRVGGLIPGLGRSPGVGNGNLLQYSCLENSINRGAWQATVLGSQRVRHYWSNLACLNSKLLPQKKLVQLFRLKDLNLH